jgi:uncharacterized protein YlzI (FlbEa/FlbD family)
MGKVKLKRGVNLRSHMIFLTKIDGSKVLINFDNVKYLEEVPDTILNFLNGDTLIVVENLEQIKVLLDG